MFFFSRAFRTNNRRVKIKLIIAISLEYFANNRFAIKLGVTKIHCKTNVEIIICRL